MMRSLVIFSGLAAVAATAQESAAQTTSGDEPVIEQIIVTATRREESVIDVPLAVSAYDAERIEISRVTDILELMRIAPSFHVATGQAESIGVTARIRGVGTNSDNPGLESSVGMYVDGVYRNRATVGLTELGAIERIEVLRGPQGTLFGRNSSAGVVSIVTALPDPDGSGYADVSIGSYGSTRVEAGASGAFGDGASARLDAVLFERDGFLEDANYDRAFNDRNRTFVRGQFVFEPSDEVRLRLIGDYTDRDENCCGAVGLIRGPTAPAVDMIARLLTGNPDTAGTLFDPYAREATASLDSSYYQAVQEGGVSLEVDAELPFGRLVSVTARRDWETSREMDVDFSSMDLGERPKGEFTLGFETFSQELRLNGQSGPLDWLVGAYYADEYLPYRDTLVYGPAFSIFADSIAGGIASGIGGAFDQLGAALPTLEAGAALIGQGAAGIAHGAAGLAQGAAALEAGLAQFAPLLPPGFAPPRAPMLPMPPTLSAALPAWPGFPFNPWPGYESIAGNLVPGARLAGAFARDTYEQDSQSWALFTHNSVELANDFELTLGLRYTSEDKSMNADLTSTDQVCLPFSQQFLGSLQGTQAYLGGVGAYAHALGAYAGALGAYPNGDIQNYAVELERFGAQLGQAAGALPPPLAQQLNQQLIPAVEQLRQGALQLSGAVAGTQAGAAQVLPGLSQVTAGGQAILQDPDVQRGLGALLALGCIPFTDPTLNGNYAGTLDGNEVSGTLRLSRRIGGHLLYGGYSRGYKAGGFNMDRSTLTSPVVAALATGQGIAPTIDQLIFLPETVDSFELGGKFSLDAWRGLLDVSLFHEEFQGYQLTAFTGLAFEALNVPEVTSRGVEIEARGAVNESLEIFGGLTYADVRFGDGPEHGFRAGRQLTHAPKVTTVGGVTTRFPLGPLAAAFNIDARYTSEHNTGANLDPLKHQDAYTVVNARLIFRSRDTTNPWTVDFWAQNLTDEEYAITIFDAPLQTGTYNAFIGDPRLYGVSVRYDF
ncbi:MAG: TonB-dependent receptor [Rhodospirillaceae bacterium]|nr:TonB-dependent receptor [Rhodospirillaceae bacterium]